MEGRSGGIVWFRRDLRLSDNEALSSAARSDVLAPFSSINPDDLAATAQPTDLPFDLPTLGPYRAKFTLEALHCLSGGLRKLESDLHFSLGQPSAAVARLVALLAQTCASVQLYYNLDYGGGAEGQAALVEDAFQQAAKAAGLSFQVHRFWDRTLNHPANLPQAWSDGSNTASAEAPLSLAQVEARLAESPPVMTDFRKAIEANNPIQLPIPAPQHLPPPPAGLLESSDQIPAKVEQLYEAAGKAASSGLEQIQAVTGIKPLTCLEGGMFPFQGGEAAAHDRLSHFIGLDGAWPSTSAEASSSKEPPLATFKGRRMMATGLDASTKLGAYLSLGCLTPRQIHAALEASEREWTSIGLGSEGNGPQAEVTALEAGASSLELHLQIRDFFQYSHLKASGTKLPKWKGSFPPEIEALGNQEAFRRWCNGTTGLPFVDAAMRELAATGYMSNRSRQNVASLLSKGCGLDWRWGEALFRCLLVDYDPASNMGNWKYVAGTDYDPRGGARQFRTVSQGMKYDPEAELAGRWLPELANLSPEERHRPWSSVGGADGGTGEGRYAPPLVDPVSQLTKADKGRLASETGI